MDKFPLPIAEGMKKSGAMITCVPVQFDGSVWESAVFFEVGGKESSKDRKILKKSRSPLPVGIEGEVITHASGSIVMLRFEVITDKVNPLAGEVLFAPGLGDTQFETLKTLSEQLTLRIYFGDTNYNVIHSQQTPLYDHERKGYAALLSEAVNHDAVLRLAGKYNATRAIEEVCDNYAYRVV